MLVMHEPMNTSSIFAPATSASVLTSSGSFGQATIGSWMSARSISMTAAYSASASRSSSWGFLTHASCAAMRRASVRPSAYPCEIIQRISVMLLLTYSMIGSLLRCTVQPAADRSADASDSSNACSTFKSGRPSISSTRPEKMFFLPFFSTVSRPCLIAYIGIAFTRSRKVTPGCICPLKRTSTDSGMSSGITPVAAANATRPEPAGKLMPIGKRVWLSAPVPTVSGSSRRLSQLWITPSPGCSETPPRVLMKSGSSWCIFTSTGLG